MTTGECIVMDGTRCILYRGYHLLIKLFGIPRWTGATSRRAGPAMNNTSFQGEEAEEDRCSSRLGPKLLINVICYRGSSLFWLVINRYRALLRSLRTENYLIPWNRRRQHTATNLLVDFVTPTSFVTRDPLLQYDLVPLLLENWEGSISVLSWSHR